MRLRHRSFKMNLIVQSIKYLREFSDL